MDFAENAMDTELNSMTDKQNSTKCRYSFICSFCGKSFNRPALLTRHLSVHTGEKPFSCCDCAKSFSQKSTLEEHIRFQHGSSKRYPCRVCPALFKKKSNLNKHNRSIHSVTAEKQSSFPCPHCRSFFNSFKGLSRHNATYHQNLTEEQKIQMTIQDVMKGLQNLNEMTEEKPFSSYYDTIAYAENRVDSVRSYRCRHCDCVFKRAYNLYRHQEIHSNDLTPYKCSECDQPFRLKTLLKKHLEGFHNIKINISSIPSIPAKNNLKEISKENHVQDFILTTDSDELKTIRLPEYPDNELIHTTNGITWHIPKEFQLSDPELTLTNDNITSHFPIESGAVEFDDNRETNGNRNENVSVTEFEILHPDQTLTTGGIAESETIEAKNKNISILSNVRIVPPKPDKNRKTTKYNCKLCSVTFKRYSDMVNHSRIHTKEKPFRCELCETDFSLKSTLKAHLNIHVKSTERTKHHCTVCGKTFLSRSSLNIHMALHKEKLKYECSLCMMTFRYPIQRIRHIQQEHRKAFRCEICQTDFSSKSTFEKHLNTVISGEHQCAVCGKTSISKCSLNIHMVIHKDVLKYECSLCRMKFHTSLLRNCHIRRKHRMTYDGKPEIKRKYKQKKDLSQLIYETQRS